MYKKIGFTENTLQVLSLFTNDFKREYHIREVGKILKISPRTSQLILEDMENKGIIQSKSRGKTKTYRLKLSGITKKYLVFAEQYKAISFLSNNPMIKEIIDNITPNIKGIGIIFGSYAKGIEKEDSDLDIFIVGDYNKEEIERVSQKWGIDISIKCYPLKIFKKNFKKDFLLIEILKGHIVFIGAEQFIQFVLKDD